MKKDKIISGGIGLLAGYIIIALIMDFLSKPDNIPLSLKPIESMQTYFFGFVFTMGNVGWILGGLLLIGCLALFFFMGTWVHKIMFRN